MCVYKVGCIYSLTYLLVGRLNEPLESLFYYDVANGHDFEYYNNSQGYTPLFDIQATATAQQQDKARQVCTIDGRLSDACVYDYYATGNAEASSVAAVAFFNYTTSQEMLGLFQFQFRFISVVSYIYIGGSPKQEFLHSEVFTEQLYSIGLLLT